MLELDEEIVGTHAVYRINIRKSLGTGSFSTVYAGKNTKTNENVAIKKIFINKMSNIENSIIDKEIEVIKLLMKRGNSHCNIITYYDVIKTKLYVYIVMELCSDGTLSSLLIKPMKKKYYKFFFLQILSALYYLHNLGIVHGDIKPDNILLCDDYKTLKICDFGFSRIIKNSIAKIRVSCGSPIYMAPEMLGNAICDKSIDLWASGMILYELMYGYHPCRKIKDIKTIQYTMNNIKIEQEYNADIDNDDINMLKRILEIDNMKRITINNVINSEWLKNTNVFNTITLSDIFYVQNTKKSSKDKHKKIELCPNAEKHNIILKTRDTTCSHSDNNIKNLLKKNDYVSHVNEYGYYSDFHVVNKNVKSSSDMINNISHISNEKIPICDMIFSFDSD